MNWINLKELVLIHELVINETGGAQRYQPYCFGVHPATFLVANFHGQGKMS